MSTGRLNLRILSAALTLACLPGAEIADAGCLDWLFGRPTTYTAGYPYAPYTVQNVGAPVAVTTAPNTGFANSGVVQAQRPAYGAPLVTSAPLTTVQTFNNPSVYSGLPVTNSPQIPASQLYSRQYSAQRMPLSSQTLAAPATTAVITPQNASSYRLPITSANQVPIASTLRGTTAPMPLSSISPSVTSTTLYSANYPSSVAPTSYSSVPATTTQVLPLNARPRRTFGSGLSRFFNSLLGRNRNYVTSYYQAPITYYRPMTSVNPVTGTTVTVQQPCTSYVQQLQRVPHNSFLPLQQGAASIQTSPIQATPNACSSIPLSGTPGSFAPPSTGIGQVGGQLQPGSYGVSPIPSSIPETGYPNAAPLTGGTSPGASSGNVAPDLEGMPKPRLQSERPSLEETDDATGANGDSADSYLNDYYDDLYPYGDQGGDTSGQSRESDGPAIQLDPPVTNRMPGSNPNDPFAGQQQLTNQTPPSLRAPLRQPSTDAPIVKAQHYSTLRPIGAPATKTAPANGAPEVRQPSNSPTFEAPPLPAPSNRGADPSALFRNSESTASSRSTSRVRVTVPIREATTRHQDVRPVAAWEEIRERPAFPKPAQRQPAPIKRDNSGWMPAR